MDFDPEFMKVRLCRSCRGLGNVEGTPCGACGGTGRYIEKCVVNEFPLGAVSLDDGTKRIRLCRQCRGRGEIGGMECRECRGHGRYVEQKLVTEIPFENAIV